MKNYNNIEELIKDINKTRIANKNNWVVFEAYYKGDFLQFKMFDTWIQRLEIHTKVNNHDIWNLFRIASSPMDISVKEFKQFVKEELLTLK